MVQINDIKDTIESIYDGNTKLDMLLEFESILDNLHLYAYKNWITGEVVDGPHISRYWVEATLMWPKKMMPDPEGARRLTKHGCYVYFQEEDFVVNVDITSPEDLETSDRGERKPKKATKPVWLVKIVMPRHFVDEFNSNKIEVNGVEIDLSDVDDAYQEGLDGEEALQQDNINDTNE